MAGATLILPFLPMLPMQILLNNLLYDVSELPIPLDEVDEEFLRRPRAWRMGFVRRFMLTLGPVSSLFDFLTFWLLLRLLRADQELFHTGWFVESLATQVLVIFVIRTRRAPWRSRPAIWLAFAALATVALAVLLPLSPLAPALGFVAPPPVFYAALAAMVALYLVAAELVKRAFYRAWIEVA
jgi:Mg2+-importing ATPase